MFSEFSISLPDVGIEWFLLLAAVVTFAWGANSLSRAISSRSWIKQEGRIEGADVRCYDFREYAVVVDYSYEAGGQHHNKSQRVFPTIGEKAEKSEAEWERSKYREGDAINVWTDPRNPSSATLIPGATYGGWRFVAAGVVLAAAGVFVRIYGVPVPSFSTPQAAVEAYDQQPPS